MPSAVRVHDIKRPGKNEQLKVVSREADVIWKKHKAGQLSADDAAKQLQELQSRYVSFFDRILAL